MAASHNTTSTGDLGKPYASPMPARKEDLLDFGGLWMAVRRRLMLFLAVAALLAAIVIAIFFVMERRYFATSQVVVSTNKTQVVTSESVIESKDPDTYAVDTQTTSLQSLDLARVVVEKLKLETNPEFIGKDAPPMGREQAIDAAADTLQRNLHVKRSGLAFVSDVTFESANPRTAAAVANAVASLYVESQRTTKTSATSEANGYIGSQLGQLRQDATAADRALAQYKAGNPMLASSEDQTVLQQQVAALNAELATARAEAANKSAAASAGRRQIASGGNGAVGGSMQSSAVGELRSQEGAVRRRLAEVSERYGPRHPLRLAAEGELTAIQTQIAQEARRNVSDLDAQAQAANSRVASIQSSLARVTGQLTGASQAKGSLGDLQREAVTAGGTYAAALQRFRDTLAQAGAQNADARVLSRAIVPSKPGTPHLPTFLAAALLAGLLGGATAVAIREALDRGLRTTSDVRKAFGMRVLATIPDFRSALTAEEKDMYGEFNSDFVVQRPFSAFTESFRMMHAALYQPGAVKPHQIVAVTSALPGEGKSTCATCLVRVAAIGGQRALLIECDTRRAGRSAVAAESDIGLLEVLAGKGRLDQALRVDKASGAMILPLSKHPLVPGDVLTTTRMDELLAELRGMFDFIVLDTAPVLPIAETRILVLKADTVAYVTRWGITPRQAAVAGMQFLQEAGANIAGVVLSQVDLNQQHKWTRNDASGFYGKYKNYYR